jgi:hypothetical protein
MTSHKEMGATFALRLRLAGDTRKGVPLVAVAGPNGHVKFQSRAPAGVTPPRAAEPWRPRDGGRDPWLVNGALPNIERDYRAAMRSRMTPAQFSAAMERRSTMLRELRAADAANLRAEAKRRAQRLAQENARFNDAMDAHRAALRASRGRGR